MYSFFLTWPKTWSTGTSRLTQSLWISRTPLIPWSLQENHIIWNVFASQIHGKETWCYWRWQQLNFRLQPACSASTSSQPKIIYFLPWGRHVSWGIKCIVLNSKSRNIYWLPNIYLCYTEFEDNIKLYFRYTKLEHLHWRFTSILLNFKVCIEGSP